MIANRYVVLAGLLVGGSSATAAPSHRKPAVDATARPEAADSDDDEGADARPQRKRADDVAQPRRRAAPPADVVGPRTRADAAQNAQPRRRRAADTDDAGTERIVAATEPDAAAPRTRAGVDGDAGTPRMRAATRDQASPEEIAQVRQSTAPSGWTFAVGPYIWASAVQADVSFGPLSTGVNIGFITLARHSRFGAEALLEARRGHFGISADIMYGEAAFSASTAIASVMTNISGKAGSLLVDSAVSYEVLGAETAPISLEARSGVRYQRNAIQGEVGVAGFMVQTPEIIDGGADFVLGARAVVRPTHSLQLAGAFDIGVAGASDSTWSATADLGYRVSRHVLLSAGWRQLTMHRSIVNIEMKGPRAAMQFVF
jgi:hypothetical protein